MGHFRQLEVWKQAHDLTLGIYRISKRFPRDEIYGITSQLRRASVSIELNIAEGCGRKRDLELRHFLDIARGSTAEVENLLLLCHDLEYVSAPEYNDYAEKADRISRMLTSFSTRLRAGSGPVTRDP